MSDEICENAELMMEKHQLFYLRAMSRHILFEIDFNRQNQLRFVYTHFKSCDQSLDKTSFDFSDKFHAMQSCAMNAKSSMIPNLPMGLVI